MFLQNFPDCRASTLSEANERIDANAKGSTFELLDKAQHFVLNANVARLGDVTLVSTGCNASCRMTMVPADYVRQIFQISANSNVSYQDAGSIKSPSGGSWLIPAGTRLNIENEAHYQSISMRIDTAALKRTTTALIGEDADLPDFDYSAPAYDAGMLSLRIATLTLAHEMDHSGSDLSAPVLAELAQTIVVKFLMYNKHNYSARLLRPEPSPSSLQLRTVEDYIAENWNHPLDIHRIAVATNISARSIFRLFAKQRGSTPAILIKKLRLNHARAMLLSNDPDTSVIAVATRCGFHSFGHFAREYREVFHELPSDTQRQNRRSGRR